MPVGMAVCDGAIRLVLYGLQRCSQVVLYGLQRCSQVVNGWVMPGHAENCQRLHAFCRHLPTRVVTVELLLEDPLRLDPVRQLLVRLPDPRHLAVFVRLFVVIQPRIHSIPRRHVSSHSHGVGSIPAPTHMQQVLGGAYRMEL